ncbi:MAG: glycosyltransferase [Cyanobacterium sp.]
MTKILHIIQQLSKGGAARSMIATAKYSAQYGNFHHQVISLLPSETFAKQQAEAVGMSVIDAPNGQTILNTIEKADIVHVHWWNNPHLYDLLRSDLPAMRLLTWFHVAGDQPPHVITKQLIDHSDFALACSPYTYNRKAFQDLNSETKTSKTGMVIAGSDFEPIKNYQKCPHSSFNVGYIGTVDFVKMHPNYVAMSANVDIPDVQFIVCGGGISNYLAQQAQQLGTSDKFDFRGYVEDIKSVLEILDVYGYPLCEETYAAAELNLQEVMYCGIPPVVFPYGGVKNLIQHNETGLIVNSEKEYKEAIEYLYHHPEERERLGNNARKYALEIFGAENAGKAINPIYEKLMQQPKLDRIWGIPVGTSLLDLPVTLEDLTGEYRQPTPAELFIEGLGGTKPEFIVSMTSQDINELFEAEEKIALSSAIISGISGGSGIISYCQYYLQDNYLRLWTALALENSQRYNEAIQNYISTINLGYTHWRVTWYLARVAEKAKDLELAKKAIYDVLKIVPNFEEAKNLLASISNSQKSPSIQVQKSLPKISIITPSFNQGEYLEDCILSVLEQGYSNLEYIILDGGSTDKSIEVIKKYEKYLTHWESKADGGHYHAVNKGFKQYSTGEIMAWINSDDKYHPDSLYKVISAFEENKQAEWIMGIPTVWDSQGNLNRVIEYIPNWSREFILNNIQECIQKSFFVEQESCFWKRSLWEKAGGSLDIEFSLAGDFELWIRFFRHAPLFVVNGLIGGFRSYSEKQRSQQYRREYINEMFAIVEREKELIKQGFYTNFISSPLRIDLNEKKINDLKETIRNQQESEIDYLINFQSLNLIIFPDWRQDEENLSLTLTEVLKSITSHPQAGEITLIIDITNAENEEDAQLLVSAVTMSLMLEEGIELPETTEISFIGNLTPQQWENLFAQMGNNQLYYLPLSMISQWENIPESALDSYCKYLLQNCQIFLNNGDAEKYLDYYSYLLQNLVQNIEKNIQSQVWQKIALIFTENSNFIPCYFNDQNLKKIYINRAKILEFTLRIKGFQLEYEFVPREVKQEKIKIGILSAHYGIQTETFSTLPVYNHLDRDKFDITLLTIKISNHRLEKYCFAHGDRVIQLPSTLSEQVNIIRSHDLDILFIGTNITARSHSITYLALHRLARIQIIDPNSPVSSGMPSIDYYITSKLSEHLPTAEEHYTEELITLDIPPQCFDFGTEANLKTNQIINREDLGLKPSQIVFVSGANYFKIIPEVEETWIKILTKVTNSVLVLYPFNPNWSNNYPISLFQERIFKTLQKYNIAEDRLIILEPVKNSLEIKERLKICDIYLDSFPYSGMTSVIDPLSVSLPTIVFSGDTSRSQKAASILRYFDLEDLITYSPEEYIKKAVLLAQNYQLREEYKEKIEQKMQSNPSFLDDKKYSKKIEKVFVNLSEKYQYENTLREFNLTQMNYLVFPDWQSDEEVLTEELYNLISTLAHNSSINDKLPDSNFPLNKGSRGGSNLPSPFGRGAGGEGVTLVIDTTGITEEDANLMLSAVAMNLMMEEELDLENLFNFSFISDFDEEQWAKLLPQITARIILDCENKEIVNSELFEDLISVMGNKNNYAIFPDWSKDEQELFTALNQFFINISTEEKATLLIDLNNSNEEEVGLFVSEVVMNLMLEEGIELSDEININFVNFSPNQWHSLKGLIKEEFTI